MEGKKTLLLALCSGIILFCLLLKFVGYQRTWQLWGIPTMSPCFADLRIITGGAESKQMGHDPLVSNPGDPWGRPLNYPRVWQGLYLLGIDQHHAVHLGIAFAALLAVGLLLATPKCDGRTVAVLMLVLFSPAVLLGVERGNTDIFIFFLLSMAILLIGRSYWGAAVVVFAAFVLKLFPVFAYAGLFRERRSLFFKVSLLAFCGAALYAVITFNDLVLISRTTPRAAYWSYGVNVAWTEFGRHIGGLKRFAQAISYLAVLAGFVWAFRGLCRRSEDYSEADSAGVDAFRVGSGVFVGTFLLGNNWDYRLVFLLFVVPHLMYLARHAPKLARLSTITICGIAVSVWHLLIARILTPLSGGGTLSLIVDEAANWIVFFGLLYLLFQHMPDWAKQIAIRCCSKPDDKTPATA